MTLPFYLGLPMWANQDWCGSLYPPHARSGLLSDYAGVFSSVEGNTTFYSGAPSTSTLNAWASQAPPAFRFCFKLPSTITHEQRLADPQAALGFLDALTPLHHQLGPTMIQLPGDFGPQELPRLAALLNVWPSHLPCAVEVRHPAFFNKGVDEQRLNRLLITFLVNRVMLDVRPVFSTPAAANTGLVHAQHEKPRLPLHVLSTADQPIIRFIGHLDKQINLDYFAPWEKQLGLWINQGKTPFLFVHTADNRHAPAMARLLYQQLAAHHRWAPLGDFPGEKQTDLF